jgi:NitT/TauT family transport system ATP-binding protein
VKLIIDPPHTELHEHLIHTNPLSHTYANGVEALRDFTLEVKRGEFVAVVGPSGCGKSTLLRILAGLIQPTRGRVFIEGKNVDQPLPSVSLMFQDPALLSWRTVEQNIALPLDIRNTNGNSEPSENALRSTLHDLISLVNLNGFEKAYPKELSGGMAQRVALARALVTQPPILLLDEPFGALDAFTRENLTAMLERVCRPLNTTMVMVTHGISEAIFIADRIIVCSPRPGRVQRAIGVDLPRPRAWEMQSEPRFGEIVREVRRALGVSTFS